MTAFRFLLLATFLIYASAIHVSVKNGPEPTATYCIVLDSNITGTIHYTTNNNEDATYNFVVNGTTIKTDGSCHTVSPGTNISAEYIEIGFFPNDVTPFPPARDLWKLKLDFEAQDGVAPPSKSFKIANYSLSTVFYSNIFNASIPSYVYKKTDSADLDWMAKDTYAFTCSNSELSLTNSSKISFSGLKVIAFAVLDQNTFPANQLFERCPADIRTSDLVPIIVGACLAGLVIVVLIAYVIGRARAKRQGYASV